MKTPACILLGATLVSLAAAQPRHYAEAAVSYLAFEGAALPAVHISLPLVARSVEKSAWAPFEAAGWSLAEPSWNRRGHAVSAGVVRRW